MTLSITHNFVSTKADGTDATLLRPSNWNEVHVIELASKTLVGRQTAGSGDAEEIPCTAAAATILAAADIAAMIELLGVSPPTTGDGRITLKTTAPTGWLMLNDGTFGDASSGGSARANDDTEDLFLLLYDSAVDASCPILTGAGTATTRAAQGSAASAFAAHCRMSLPKQLGRAIAIAGTGAALTARPLGSSLGEETHTLTLGETATGIISAVTVTGTVNSLQFGGSSANFQAIGAGGGGNDSFVSPGGTGKRVIVGGEVGGSISGTGTATSNNTGGAAHNNMQPTTFWNVMVKL